MSVALTTFIVTVIPIPNPLIVEEPQRADQIDCAVDNDIDLADAEIAVALAEIDTEDIGAAPGAPGIQAKSHAHTVHQTANHTGGQETNILVTAISKYEINLVRRTVQKIDPNAFIIYNKILNIDGNYLKKL